MRDRQQRHETNRLLSSSFTICPAICRRAARSKKNHKVLHRPAQDDSDQNPKRAGQIPELGRQHRAHQRARSRKWPRNDAQKQSIYWF